MQVPPERSTLAQRRRRSPTELQEALGIHIEYEVSACAEYARRLATHHSSDRDEEIAYLEALLLHARALHEFLLRPLVDRPRQEDMLRTDFAPEWDPKADDSGTKRLKRAATELDVAVPDMHKHLMHLTWRRVEDQGPAVWSFVDIAQRVTVVVGAWARHVEAAKAEEVAASSCLPPFEVGAHIAVQLSAGLLAEIAESHADGLATLLAEHLSEAEAPDIHRPDAQGLPPEDSIMR